MPGSQSISPFWTLDTILCLQWRKLLLHGRKIQVRVGSEASVDTDCSFLLCALTVYIFGADSHIQNDPTGLYDVLVNLPVSYEGCKSEDGTVRSWCGGSEVHFPSCILCKCVYNLECLQFFVFFLKWRNRARSARLRLCLSKRNFLCYSSVDHPKCISTS